MDQPTRLRDLMLMEHARRLNPCAGALALTAAAVVRQFRAAGVQDPRTVAPGRWGWFVNSAVGNVMYVVKDLAAFAAFDELADVWARLGEGEAVGPQHAAYVEKVRAVVKAAPEYVEPTETVSARDEAVEHALLAAVLDLGTWLIENSGEPTG